MTWKKLQFVAYVILGPAAIYFAMFGHFECANDCQAMTAVFLAVGGLVTYRMQTT